MSTAYIVACTRTAVGRHKGALRNSHSVSIGAKCVNELLRKVPSLNPIDVDDVIFGSVSQVGEQAGNMARSVVLSSDLPISVPGVTVDRQCGSSQQALHFACQAVMSGTQDIVIAGGAESMTRVPMFSNFPKKLGGPNTPEIKEKFNVTEDFFSQFVGAEMLAAKYQVTKKEMDEFASSSHAKALAARSSGRFKQEIVEVVGTDKEGNSILFDTDEGIRPGTTAEKLGELKTLVDMGMTKAVEGGAKNGVITAGNASQMSDGAAALLIVNEEGLKKLGTDVKPLAKIKSLALAAEDPLLMLSGPIPATEKALKKAGLTIDDIGIYEVNEAFAVVPLAWQKTVGAKMEKLNVNGGACALGHPLGATGAKLMTTLVHELGKRGEKYGLLAICEGGGTANATIIENCQI